MAIKRLFIILVAGSFIIAGCGGKAAEEAPTPEPVIPEPVVEEVIEPEELQPVVEPVEEPEEEILTEIPQATIEIPETLGQDVERGLHPDSALFRYMIRPDDWLSKIALKEYGNPGEWRRIYNWNREAIGDNPNLIYPYNELDLYKPDYEVTEQVVDFITHEVQPGENLWTIAILEYGDGKAWSVLFWDNEELLNTNSGMLKPGMQLQVRTYLWSDR
ncbi:MAG: hypothetical protein V3W14_03015 [Candidatus Neomarinimicrobiota bacterium]